MATHDLTERRPHIASGRSPSARRQHGSIGLILLIAVVLVGAAAGVLFAGREQAEPYVLTLLAVLAMAGVFSLFASAAGILRLGSGRLEDPLFRHILDDAPDAIVLADSSGRVVYANTAYRALIDVTGGDGLVPVERAFIADPNVSEAIYRLLKVAREGQWQQEEVRLGAAKDGAARWLRLRVRQEGGCDAPRTIWSIADVSRERERQEHVFKELQHAIDHLDRAPAGFFSIDAQGSLVYINATLATWLDYDLAQVGTGGLRLSDIVSEPEAAMLSTFIGEPGEVTTKVLDLDLKTRGGRPLPARIHHQVTHAADGKLCFSRTLVLSRENQATDPQRSAEVRFMRFFHNAPMAIAAVDRLGRICRSNAAFTRMFADVLGSDGEELSLFSVLAEHDRPLLEALIHKAADGEVDIAPQEAALATGADSWANFYVAAVDQVERDTEAAIVYVIETTEQRKLKHQFDQSEKNRAIGQLAGGMAHDFNNVLSAIMMATDFLLNAHKPTDPSFQDIMQIKQNANRAAGLVRQLLAFSRRQTLRLQVLDLVETLSDLSMLLRRLIGERVGIEVVHGRDLWPVKADLSQFERVIVNLAVNARDAMPDGGRLTLRTANVTPAESAAFGYKSMPPAEYVLIEVRDTGTGIPPEIIDKIFEPFFSTKEAGQGFGLGLATVYGIVKQTGGFIYVESEPGKGTAFRVFLPRYAPPMGVEPPSPKLAVRGVGSAAVAVDEAVRVTAPDLTGQGTILLVEDEQGLRSLNARGLASRGYTVLEAANGVEAMEILQQRNGQVDLVISDVVMPEMDGPTLFKVLRERSPDIKVVFVSGYAEDAFQQHLAATDQVAFLPKPFTLKQLVGVVKETMAT